MDYNLFIAFIAVLLNMILCTIIPCLLKDSDKSFLADIKKVYTNNKDLILVCSLIYGLTVYIALTIGPSLNITFNNMLGIPVNESQNIPLKYLINLRSN